MSTGLKFFTVFLFISLSYLFVREDTLIFLFENISKDLDRKAKSVNQSYLEEYQTLTKKFGDSIALGGGVIVSSAQELYSPSLSRELTKTWDNISTSIDRIQRSNSPQDGSINQPTNQPINQGEQTVKTTLPNHSEGRLTLVGSTQIVTPHFKFIPYHYTQVVEGDIILPQEDYSYFTGYIEHSDPSFQGKGLESVDPLAKKTPLEEESQKTKTKLKREEESYYTGDKVYFNLFSLAKGEEPPRLLYRLKPHHLVIGTRDYYLFPLKELKEKGLERFHYELAFLGEANGTIAVDFKAKEGKQVAVGRNFLAHFTGSHKGNGNDNGNHPEKGQEPTNKGLQPSLSVQHASKWTLFKPLGFRAEWQQTQPRLHLDPYLFYPPNSFSFRVFRYLSWFYLFFLTLLWLFLLLSGYRLSFRSWLIFSLALGLFVAWFVLLRIALGFSLAFFIGGGALSLFIPFYFVFLLAKQLTNQKRIFLFGAYWLVGSLIGVTLFYLLIVSLKDLLFLWGLPAMGGIGSIGLIFIIASRKERTDKKEDLPPQQNLFGFSK